jgi:hypothetical protein
MAWVSCARSRTGPTNNPETSITAAHTRLLEIPIRTPRFFDERKFYPICHA